MTKKHSMAQYTHSRAKTMEVVQAGKLGHRSTLGNTAYLTDVESFLDKIVFSDL